MMKVIFVFIMEKYWVNYYRENKNRYWSKPFLMKLSFGRRTLDNFEIRYCSQQKCCRTRHKQKVEIRTFSNTKKNIVFEYNRKPKIRADQEKIAYR